MVISGILAASGGQRAAQIVLLPLLFVALGVMVLFVVVLTGVFIEQLQEDRKRFLFWFGIIFVIATLVNLAFGAQTSTSLAGGGGAGLVAAFVIFLTT